MNELVQGREVYYGVASRPKISLLGRGGCRNQGLGLKLFPEPLSPSLCRSPRGDREHAPNPAGTLETGPGDLVMGRGRGGGGVL